LCGFIITLSSLPAFFNAGVGYRVLCVVASFVAKIRDSNFELEALNCVFHFGSEIRFDERVISVSLFVRAQLSFSLHAAAM
jgi:hypothetical protein